MKRERALRFLEERVETLEYEYEKFDMDLKEQYIKTILDKYTPLINQLCNNAYKRLHLNFVDQDDLKQEFVEYLLKWTYCECRKRVFSGSNQVWVPFIKRSFRNFMVNFQISYKKGGKRRPLGEIVSLSNTDNTFLEEVLAFRMDTVYDDLELKDYTLNFYSNLERPIDRKVFKILFSPSDSFLEFSMDNFKKLCIFEIVARYIGFSYSSVLNSYNRIRVGFKQGLLNSEE